MIAILANWLVLIPLMVIIMAVTISSKCISVSETVTNRLLWDLSGYSFSGNSRAGYGNQWG